MKKFILSGVISLFALASCTKENLPESITGNWVNTSNDYVAVLNSSYDFVDIYATPWSGTIKINNQPIDLTNLKYGIDNVFGRKIFYSQNFGVIFNGNSLSIQYNGKTYIYSESYSLNLATGIFKADGVAYENENQISVYLDLQASKSKIKPNTEFTVPDYQYTGILPIVQLSFESNGRFNGLLLSGDTPILFDGNWRKNSGLILLQANFTDYQGGFQDEYKFTISSNNTLSLIKENMIDQFESYTGIPASYITSAKYKTSYTRK